MFILWTLDLVLFPVCSVQLTGTNIPVGRVNVCVSWFICLVTKGERAHGGSGQSRNDENVG